MQPAEQAATTSELAALREEVARLRPLADLGRMAATVAHEVRNPLAGISANAELVREALAGADDQACIDIILSEVDRLGRLVTDLLFYARERDAKTVRTDLARLARTTCELSSAAAQGAGVELAWSGAGEGLTDPELARQALLNVVRNAIEACRAGQAVHLDVSAGRIAVVDQGAGVPAAVRERLFEPFVTGRTRGLGLGGAVAKRCQLRQGGDLRLVSSSASGSCFELSWATSASSSPLNGANSSTSTQSR
jgi:signal transduction histidine kinase